MTRIHPYITSLFMVIQTAGSAGIMPRCNSKSEVTARVGGTAVLSCSFFLPGQPANLKIVWQKTGEGLEDHVVRCQNTDEDWDNNNDVCMGKTTTYKKWLQCKDATLEMDRINQSHAGQYSCCTKWSQKGPKYIYKCCTIRLNVEQEWRGDRRQLIVTWSMYLLFLSLCLYSLYRCGSQQRLNQNISA